MVLESVGQSLVQFDAAGLGTDPGLLSDALMELGATSVSVQDSELGTSAETPIFRQLDWLFAREDSLLSGEPSPKAQQELDIEGLMEKQPTRIQSFQRSDMKGRVKSSPRTQSDSPEEKRARSKVSRRVSFASRRSPMEEDEAQLRF